MKRISIVMLFWALVALPQGCNKFSPQDKTESHARTSGQFDTEERALELQARRAKHDIDQITSQAEEALHNAETKLQSHAQRPSQQLSEFAAEVSEQAKDRAEDVPEEVDRALDRVRNFRSGRDSNRYSDRDEDDSSR